MRRLLWLVPLIALGACEQSAPVAAPEVYDSVSVESRDIQVTVDAAGIVEPESTVEVKSKASGEILQMLVETGQTVERGALMVRVDPRTPKNTVAQAQAEHQWLVDHKHQAEADSLKVTIDAWVLAKAEGRKVSAEKLGW